MCNILSINLRKKKSYLENFRFKEGSWGPWDSILDAIPDSDKSNLDY